MNSVTRSWCSLIISVQDLDPVWASGSRTLHAEKVPHVLGIKIGIGTKSTDYLQVSCCVVDQNQVKRLVSDPLPREKKRYKGFTIQPNKYEKCRSKTVRMYQYTFTLYYTFRTIIKLNIFPIYTVSNYLLFSYINQIILLSIFINVNYVDCDYIIEMRINGLNSYH